VVERGVPIAFCAQSVGPFRRPRERAILERVYGAAVAIGLRERHSEANVLDLGADPARVFVTADEAFSLIEADAVRGSPGRGIACVLSGHPWLHASGSVVEPDRAVDALSRMLADLVELSAGEHVTLLSTQQGLGATRRGLEDDAEVAQRAVAALPDDLAQAVRTVPGYLAPMQCADVVASHRGLLSMRMHPAIFGLCLGVPTVLVTEAFKVTAMFDALGLGSTVFSWADRSAAVERLRDEPAVPPRRLETARRCAGGNDAVVQRLLDAALYRSSRS
jgi:colanic acid/amylovoran biosynthesis protein